jgi:hypothetical protein
VSEKICGGLPLYSNVPIISASLSWLIFGVTSSGRPSFRSSPAEGAAGPGAFRWNVPSPLPAARLRVDDITQNLKKPQGG